MKVFMNDREREKEHTQENDEKRIFKRFRMQHKLG